MLTGFVSRQFLGEDGMDTDLPTKFELYVLRTVLGKAFFWCVGFMIGLPLTPSLTFVRSSLRSTFQIFFYALRPGFVRQQQPTKWIALNLATQLAFNTFVVKYFGWSSMLYFLLSSHMAGSLHPLSGHFIAEHFSESFSAVSRFIERLGLIPLFAPSLQCSRGSIRRRGPTTVLSTSSPTMYVMLSNSSVLSTSCIFALDFVSAEEAASPCSIGARSPSHAS